MWAPFIFSELYPSLCFFRLATLNWAHNHTVSTWQQEEQLWHARPTEQTDSLTLLEEIALSLAAIISSSGPFLWITQKTMESVTKPATVAISKFVISTSQNLHHHPLKISTTISNNKTPALKWNRHKNDCCPCAGRRLLDQNYCLEFSQNQKTALQSRSRFCICLPVVTDSGRKLQRIKGSGKSFDRGCI